MTILPPSLPYDRTFPHHARKWIDKVTAPVRFRCTANFIAYFALWELMSSALASQGGRTVTFAPYLLLCVSPFIFRTPHDSCFLQDVRNRWCRRRTDTYLPPKEEKSHSFLSDSLLIVNRHRWCLHVLTVKSFPRREAYVRRVQAIHCNFRLLKSRQTEDEWEMLILRWACEGMGFWNLI